MALTTDKKELTDKMVDCQEKLAYSFKNIKLLENALTHTSFKTPYNPSNERLEFLGDAILGMVISEYLFKKFPDYSEGKLTNDYKNDIISKTIDETMKFNEENSIYGNSQKNTRKRNITEKIARTFNDYDEMIEKLSKYIDIELLKNILKIDGIYLSGATLTNVLVSAESKTKLNDEMSDLDFFIVDRCAIQPLYNLVCSAMSSSVMSYNKSKGSNVITLKLSKLKKTEDKEKKKPEMEEVFDENKNGNEKVKVDIAVKDKVSIKQKKVEIDNSEDEDEHDEDENEDELAESVEIPKVQERTRHVKKGKSKDEKPKNIEQKGIDIQFIFMLNNNLDVVDPFTKMILNCIAYDTDYTKAFAIWNNKSNKMDVYSTYDWYIANLHGKCYIIPGTSVPNRIEKMMDRG